MGFYFERISRPALADVEIDWNGLAATDVYPARLPDLFAGRPIIVTGKFRGAVGRCRGARPARIGGRVLRRGCGPRFATTSAAQPAGHGCASRTSRGGKLERRSDLAEGLLATALEHSLMSAYTSFVAVDASERTAGERGTTVHQAVPVPNGVRYDTTVIAEVEPRSEQAVLCRGIGDRRSRDLRE